MTVTVVGHWELSWNTPIKEADLWDLPLRDFGVSDWWMWPVTGIRHGEQKVTLRERASLAEILEEVSGTRVFVEPRNEHFDSSMTSVDLQNFSHPEDSLYIFGSAHFNPTVAHKKGDDLGVTLPTVENNGVLWPHQVLVAVLYDRLVKSWQ